MTGTLDHYGILGVSVHATQVEIAAAFSKQLRRYSKDERDPIGNREFRRLVIAFQVLSDQERRTAFDRSLGPRDARESKALNIQLFASQTTLPAIEEVQVLYLLIEISASPSLRWSEPSVNLSLVVDRSTSMRGNRINQVKEAAALMIEALKEQDSFSLITFSDRAEVVVPAGKIENKQYVRSKISQMSTGGATEILQGLMVGVAELTKETKSSEINHLILLTDGHTYGDEAGSVELARRAAVNGVGLSALGIGHDWNDRFLDELVAPSGGESAYLDSPDQIIDFLEQRVQTLNRAYAQDVRLRFDFPPGVGLRSVHRLAPSPASISYSNLGMALGTLPYNIPMSALVELVIQSHPPNKSTRLQVGISATIIPEGGDNQRFMDQLTLKFALNPPKALLLPAVVRAVNRLSLYQMNEKARKDVEKGDVDQAQRRMAHLGSRLNLAGEVELARTAFVEAENIARTGHLSPEGRKKLKYGTRTLLGS